MKARIKIEGDVLEIALTEVQEHDLGRVANIEMALLRAYTGHRALPWVEPRALGKEDDAGLLIQWVRGNADHTIAEKAREVLRSFCLEV